MKLRLALAPLVLSSTVAYAQAPGEYDGGSGDFAPPSMAPEVAPAPPPPPPQRIRRWSVGVGIGRTGLAPHSAPDNETEFAVGQLAVRVLATRHLEVELAFTGGSEQLEDGSDGSLELSQAVLALRWRFNPQRRWNWWLMAGMGTLAVTHQGASDEARDAAHQSTLQFGVGLERRWHRFALQAELRAVGVAPNEEVMVDVAPPGGGMSTEAIDVGGKKGGQFAVTANYYF